MEFCEFLAPCVLEDRDNDNGTVDDANLLPRKDGGPRPVCRGVLNMPTKETLELWSNHFVSHNQEAIVTCHDSRTLGPCSEMRSVYVQPNLGFVHRKYMKGLGRPRDGHPVAGDKNVTGTVNRTIASMIVLQQTKQ